MKKYKLILYTQSNAVPFDVVSDADNFQEAIAQALDEAGTVLLNLADGGYIVVSAINTVAIVVYSYDEMTGDINTDDVDPPRLKKTVISKI